MTDARDEHVNGVTHGVIGCAIRVHRALGPGLLESAYRTCLAFELQRSGLEVARERAVPIVYERVRLDCGYRLDIVVGSLVIVEVKSVQAVLPIHLAQVLTYLKLTGLPIALLVNFNVPRLVEGIQRVINPCRDKG
jgi:GxxExxY protein